MPTRYVYIVKGTEMDIVGVWSSREEAIKEAINHVKDSGVETFDIEDTNDSYVSLTPVRYETYEKAEVLRYQIQ